MSALYNATVAFEKILPKPEQVESWNIETQFDYAFGELHRVFYDVCDVSQEDPWLIAVVKPFVVNNHMHVSSFDIAVTELRYYLKSH